MASKFSTGYVIVNDSHYFSITNIFLYLKKIYFLHLSAICSVFFELIFKIDDGLF